MHVVALNAGSLGGNLHHTKEVARIDRGYQPQLGVETITTGQWKVRPPQRCRHGHRSWASEPTARATSTSGQMARGRRGLLTSIRHRSAQATVVLGADSS
jgi:hypothetical protein